jgi:WD40 repeat protein
LEDALQHQDEVNVARFSPDGQQVATASDDRTAQLWDAATGERIGPPLRHEGEVVDVAFSSDGRMLATASWDGSARLWDVATGEPCVLPLFHNGPRVTSVSFSSHAHTLVTGSWDGTARLWDTQTGLLRGEPLRHNARVYLVVFSPDGRSIATTTNEKLVRLWDYVPPAEDDARRIGLWTRVWTGQSWDKRGDLTPLTFPQWLSDKKQLDQLGGPPIPSAGPASGSPPKK